MVDLYVRHCQILIYSYGIDVRPLYYLIFRPEKDDAETEALLWAVSHNECPVGVLADRIDERYPECSELTEMLRTATGVGEKGDVI
jgi:hypothetical protein